MRDQQWPRQWLVAWRHQAITWASVEPELCLCLFQMGDHDDLDDIVKYLELEQQFSTKKNKVCEYLK